MKSQFVKVVIDVDCEWHGDPPTYRCYVEDELFAERTWIWHNNYLEEELQIQAPPGKYVIRYELIGNNAKLNIANARVEVGLAKIQNNVLEILREDS